MNNSWTIPDYSGKVNRIRNTCNVITTKTSKPMGKIQHPSGQVGVLHFELLGYDTRVPHCRYTDPVLVHPFWTCTLWLGTWYPIKASPTFDQPFVPILFSPKCRKYTHMMSVLTNECSVTFRTQYIIQWIRIHQRCNIVYWCTCGFILCCAIFQHRQLIFLGILL